MFTPTTYTPAGIGSATIGPGDAIGSATYTGGNEPVGTLVDYYILNQDGSYILNQDGSRIIWATLLEDVVNGDGLTAATYLVGNDV